MINIIILNLSIKQKKIFYLFKRILPALVLFAFILPCNSQDTQNPETAKTKNEFNDSEYLEKINQYMSDGSEDTQTNLKTESENSQNNNAQNNTMPNTQYDLGMLIRFILSLLLVVGAIYLIYFLLKKKYKLDTVSSNFIRILLSQSLAPGKLLQVIELAGKCFVLGITNENISLITEINDKETIDQLKIHASENESNKKSFVKNLWQFMNIYSSGNQSINNKKNMNNFNPFSILDTGKTRLKKLNGE